MNTELCSFTCNNGYANTPQWYVIRMLPVLFWCAFIADTNLTILLSLTVYYCLYCSSIANENVRSSTICTIYSELL